MTHRRLYDLLNSFPVDKRTLVKAAHFAGFKLKRCGHAGPMISQEDFEQIERDGFPYYQDRMTTKGIR